MPHVALDVHLALFALGRRWQSHYTKYAWAHAVGDGLDRSALTGAIPAFEYHAGLEPFVHYPLLQPDEFAVQALEFLLVVAALEFVGCRIALALLVFFHG